MTIRRYQSYKESGFRWIKEIPDSWEIAPLAKLAEVIDPQPDHRAPAIAEGTYGHPYIGIRDIHPDGTVNIETARTVEEEALIKQESSFTIDPGDLIFCKVGTLGLPRIIRPSCRIALSATLVLIKAKRGQESVFLRYSLDAQSTYAQIGELATGSTRSALGIQQIRKFRIANPPRQDQRAIARFLDRETAKIDALIAEQQRLIELLQEKRQAVISHAVTKGLNPNVPMKDSGVEWLGQVPEHWGIGQSRRRFALRNEAAGADDEQLTASQKHGIIRQSEFIELEGRRVVEVIKGQEILKHVEPGDFVISMRSFQGGLEYSEIRGSISSAYVMLQPVKDVLPEFFAWLFKSTPYIQALQSTTNLVRDGQALRYSNFCQVRLPIVPLAEQESIANYLRVETRRIDQFNEAAQHQVKLLQERRSALISAAVTGQIDVRGLATEEEP